MTLDEVAALEQDWIGRVAITQPDVYFDWQPAPVALFTQLLTAVLPTARKVPASPAFLDVGCGIGTKCLLAQQAGLTAYGIDRVPEYLAETTALGISAEQILAEDYTGYGNFGLVYLNHPLNCGTGCVDQAVLAASIQAQMASGAVLLDINYDLAPGCLNPLHSAAVVPCDDSCTQGYLGVYDGWTEITRYGTWHAAWVKS